MLQEYLFEVIPKPGSANAWVNALSHQDKLLGGKGALEPVIMLLNAHHVVINTEFAARVCIKAEDEQPSNWFNQVLEGWKAGSSLYVLTKLHMDSMSQMNDHLAEGHFS